MVDDQAPTEIPDVDDDFPDAPPPPTPAPATTAPPEPAEPANDANARRIEGMSKGLQKLTQEISQLTRKMDNNGKLNQVEQAKFAQSIQDFNSLKGELREYAKDGGDGIDQKVTNMILLLTEKFEKLESENRQLRERVESDAPPVKTAEQIWAEQKVLHPGKDVKKVWKDATDSAAQRPAMVRAKKQLDAGLITLDDYDARVSEVAEVIYEERLKSPQVPTASPAPSTPPPGKRAVPMTGGRTSAPAAPTQFDEADDIAMRASEEMDKMGL